MAKPESSPTQEVIEIDHIANDALVLKNGGLRKILLVSGLNFDLKSEEERNVILFAYQGFLNSLNFSVQEFIHTRKINIDDYLYKLEQKKGEESNELLKGLIGEYKEFITSLISQNPIMSKAFFVVVPYDPITLPQTGKTTIKKILSVFRAKEGPQSQENENNSGAADKASFAQLEQRTDQATIGLSQIGLRVVPLNEKELEELFYNLYNPETIEKKKTL